MRCSPCLFPFFLASTLALAGCGDEVPMGPGPLDAGGDAPDAGDAMDAPADVPVDRGPPVLDSGCPAPQQMTPAQVPAGFLTPMTVPLLNSIDGDTSEFSFAILGRTTVRYLWVNTEESRGAETTAFGMMTSRRVAAYLSGAHTFVVAPRNSMRRPGMHDTDGFGRSLALVFVDGELLQQRLVREGLSAYYTDFGCAPEPIHTALLLSEAEARANRRGIWAPGHPTSYADVFARWITGGARACRPNPFRGQSYCP